jgi:hypothetical protein
LIEFDEDPLVENLWMTKPTLFHIAEKLSAMQNKQHTKYIKAIIIEILS